MEPHSASWPGESRTLSASSDALPRVGDESNSRTRVENDVSGGADAGVVLGDGADPLLERNQIHRNAAQGVRAAAGAKGRLLRNVIEHNGAEGVLSEVGAAPTLGENFVRHNDGDAGGFEDGAVIDETASSVWIR